MHEDYTQNRIQDLIMMNNSRQSVYHSQKILQPESLLFLLLIVIEFIVTAILSTGHIIPSGHDGLHYFTMQYYFLNNAVIAGEIPHWIPYITHGTLANWFYTFQAGIFQNVLLLITPGILKGVNFLAIFNFGMLIDKLILITGLWFLGKRLFRSIYTVFFVTLTISATSIWFIQPWYNLHLYYCLPLILHFFHRFLETGRWRFFLLGGNLIAFQMLGNLIYFLPIITFTIFLYFLAYILTEWKTTRAQINSIKWGGKFLASSTVILLSFGLVKILLSHGQDQVILYTGRNLDGTSALKDFLIYGLNMDLWKWLELFIGISPALDFNLYAGILSAIMIIFGVINLRKKIFPIVFVALMLTLFHMGSFVSSAAYYSWPLMKYYRHLALIAPLIKFFLCFIAGWGLESFLIENKKSFPRNQKILYGILLTILGLIYAYLNFHPQTTAILVEKIVESKIPDSLPQFPILLPEIAFRFSFITLYSVGILAFIFVALLKTDLKIRRIILLGLLSIHFVDIYTYSFFETKKRAYRIPDEEYEFLLPLQEFYYPVKREKAFLSGPPERKVFLKENNLPSGQTYWSITAFAFKDQCGTVGRTDYWLAPLDDFMRAYWGQPIHDKTTPPAGMSFYRYNLLFPYQHPAAAKFAGIDREKIQFFTDAVKLTDRDAIAENIVRSQYHGDFPFIFNDEPMTQQELASQKIQAIDANTNILLPYIIKKYDSNNIHIQVNNTSGKDVWMIYSDVWNPLWKVTMNGKPAKIHQTNLAYKAILLPPGETEVHFRFYLLALGILQKNSGILSIAWLWLVGYYATLILRNKTNPSYA
jgi:hypothetical protein